MTGVLAVAEVDELRAKVTDVACSLKRWVDITVAKTIALFCGVLPSTPEADAVESDVCAA